MVGGRDLGWNALPAGDDGFMTLTVITVAAVAPTDDPTQLFMPADGNQQHTKYFLRTIRSNHIPS